MNGAEHLDPFLWGEDVVVKELCAPGKPWARDPTLLTNKIRDEEMDGKTLLTYSLLYSGRELMECLGVKPARHKAALAEAITDLRFKSQGFRQWKIDFDRKQDGYSLDVSGDDGNQPVASEAPQLPQSMPTAEPNNSQRGDEPATEAPVNSKTTVTPTIIEAGHPPTSQSRLPLNAETTNTASDSAPESSNFLDASERPAKKRRVLPTQLDSRPISAFPQPVLTEADGLHDLLTLRSLRAEDGEQIFPWDNAPAHAYLGEGSWNMSLIKSSTGASSAQLIEMRAGGFATPVPTHLPNGRRLALYKQMRRLFQRNGRVEALYKDGLAPMRSPTPSDSGSEVLDLSDLESLDEDTRREMAEEELEREQAAMRASNRVVRPERVQAILDEVMDEMKTKWEQKKLPKHQRKAHSLWTLVRRRDIRNTEVSNAQSRVIFYERRINRICSEILGESWSKEADVRRQAAVLEANVEDKLHSNWLADMLLSRIEPPKPHALPKPARPTARRPRSPMGSEILTSSDEESFIVPDQEGEAVNEVVDFMDYILGDVPPAENEARKTPVGAGSPVYLDLTQDTPEKPPQSSSRQDTVDLNSPVKRRAPKSATKNDDKHKVEEFSSDAPLIDSLEAISEIAEQSPGHWAKEKDRWRLTVALLWRLTQGRRMWIFSLLKKLPDEDAWEKSIFRQLSSPLDDESQIGQDEDQTGAFDFTHVFLSFLKVKKRKHPRIASLSKSDSKVLSDAEEAYWPGFCAFLRKITPLFPDDSQIWRGDDEIDDGIVADEDIGEDPLPSEQNSVKPPRKAAVKEVIRNKDAVDLRDREKRRALELDARRESVRASLADSGFASSDKSRLIINDTKQDDQGFIYVYEEIGKLIKAHQIDGVRFMWNQLTIDPKMRTGGLLAHTMGLGKSMQVITLLIALAEASASSDPTVQAQVPEDLRQSKTIVLCPAFLVDNWIDEFLKWAPKELLGELLKVESAMSEQERLHTIRSWADTGGVLIIGYHMLKGIVKDDEEMEQLLIDSPNIVIADEAHMFKNPTSQVHQVCSRFRTSSRIALTGSPLANNVEEYYSMIDWVAPNFLGPLKEFRDIYATPIEQGLWNDSLGYQKRKALMRLHALKETVAPKVHRRSFNACLKRDLPQKREFVISVWPTPIQRKLYDIYISPYTESGIAEGSIFTTVNNLALICNHPRCFQQHALNLRQKGQDGENSSVPERTITGTLIEASRQPDMSNGLLSQKVVLLTKILDEARSFNDKVLVFSRSIPTMDYLSNLFQQQKRRFSRLDGTMHVGKRQGMVKAFNESNQEVYLISTKAGGVGLNIHGANRVVIFDSKWNPVDEQQAIGRAYRLGQTKPVFVYQLIVAGTFEEDLHNDAVFKMQLQSRVVDQKNPISWSKRRNGLMHHIRENLPEGDVESFLGTDTVLDKLLRSENHRSAIRNIVSTDTFEEEDLTINLTAEERKEAEKEANLNRFRTANPQEYNRMKEQERLIQASVLANEARQAPQASQTHGTYQARPPRTLAQNAQTIQASSSQAPHTPQGSQARHAAHDLQSSLAQNAAGASRGQTAQSQPAPSLPSNGPQSYPPVSQSMDGAYDAPDSRLGNALNRLAQNELHSGVAPAVSLPVPSPLRGANTFFGRGEQPTRPEPSKPSTTNSFVSSQGSIFSQTMSQAKVEFENKLKSVIEELYRAGTFGAGVPPTNVAEKLTTTVNEHRKQKAFGFLPDNARWKLLDGLLVSQRFALAAASGHLTPTWLALADEEDLRRRVAILDGLSKSEFDGQLAKVLNQSDPQNLQNIRRPGVDGHGATLNKRALDDLNVMRAIAENRKQRGDIRLPSWANEALSEDRGQQRYDRQGGHDN